MRRNKKKLFRKIKKKSFKFEKNLPSAQKTENFKIVFWAYSNFKRRLYCWPRHFKKSKRQICELFECNIIFIQIKKKIQPIYWKRRLTFQLRQKDFRYILSVFSAFTICKRRYLQQTRWTTQVWKTRKKSCK